MAEPRRSYRPAAGTPAPASPPAPRPEQAPEQKKGTFIPISGLFRSKSGKADTVFVTEAIVTELQNIRPGDTLGISTNAKTKRPMLWYIAKEE
jgi:hypothetical protein